MPRTIIRHYKKGPLKNTVARGGEPIGRGHPGNHLVYTEEEAVAAGIVFHRDWRVSVPGDWALSDDGFVLQLAHCYTIKCKGRINAYHYKFVVGGVLVSAQKAGAARLLCKPYFDLGDSGERLHWASTRPEPRVASFLRSKNVRDAIDVYVRLWIARRGRLSRSDWEAIARVSQPMTKEPWMRAQYLRKDPRIQGAMMDRLAEELSGLGMNTEQLAKWMNDTFKVAKEAGNVKEMRAMVEFMHKAITPTLEAEGAPRGGRRFTQISAGVRPVGALAAPAWDYAKEREKAEADDAEELSVEGSE